jgi:hypothetical protein
MRCDSCGKEVSNDEAVCGTTNVPIDIPRGYGKAYTRTAPTWHCKECASYRHNNIRLVFWIVGVLPTIGVISALIHNLC